MKIKFSGFNAPGRRRRAFTLAEVLISTVIAAIMFISFYAAICAGITTTQVTRENLRATEIMLNQAETIRLINWSNLTNTNMLPATFTASYNPNGTNGNTGVTYSGTMTIAPASLASPASSYSSNMYKITITLNWNSIGVPRTRSMTTYYAQYGIQNYVWSNAN